MKNMYEKYAKFTMTSVNKIELTNENYLIKVFAICYKKISMKFYFTKFQNKNVLNKSPKILPQKSWYSWKFLIIEEKTFPIFSCISFNFYDCF